MKRSIYRWFVGMQIGCVALTGCHPTQPFFLGERGDLAHYIDRAQKIEYPDLEVSPLPEADRTLEPLSLDNQTFEFLDLSLEECISYALVNNHLARTLPGSQRQNADVSATILSSPSQQLNTPYDPAITATTTSSQPQVVDQNGNRILARGSARANQVGGVEDALSEFDAQFSSVLSFNTTDRARNVGAGNVFNPQLFQGRDTTGQMAISKRMATGAVATIRSQSIYSYNNIPTQSQGAGNFGRAVPSDYTQILEAQVQHPLLRGRGTLVNRIPIVLARINEDKSITDFEERVRNVVRDVEFAYWDLYQAYWNVENARIARDSAAESYKIAFSKFQKGGAGIAEAQAKTTYHDLMSQFQSALGGGNVQGNDPGLYGRERNLRFLMGWAATDGRLIRPSDKPAVGFAQFDWYTILGETLTRNVDLRKQRWEIKQRELELISAKNQSLPDLNLSLSYRWLGVGSSLIDRRGGNPPFPSGGGTASAAEELLSGDYQEGSARVEFTPNAFGSRRQLNDIRNKQLALARDTKVLEEKEVAASIKLSNLWGELVTHHSQMTEQFNSLISAQNQVELLKAKFDAGDGQQEQVVDQLLRAQQQRANAGRNYTRALAEYNKSIVEIHAIKGSLLEYNNIVLEEGLWPGKAYWDAHERARERDAATFLDYGASRPRVISRGEYEQHNGNANSAATTNERDPRNIKSSEQQQDSGESGSGDLPEVIPAKPESQIEELPGKKASLKREPKFSWDK